MIEVKNISFPVNLDETQIKEIIAKNIGVDARNILSFKYIRKSVDARKKSDVRFNVNVGVELNVDNEAEIDIVNRAADDKVRLFTPPRKMEIKKVEYGISPVVCGAGPAGLFAALWLARAGLKPILIERGADADTRIRQIENFNNGGKLDLRANVQFGEGGAGTFSDGKLTTNIHDARCDAVLETFYECGAPEEILYLAKPHLGTDNLCNIVKNMRHEIIKNGGDVRFFTKLIDIKTENGKICGVVVEKDGLTEEIVTDRLIVAAGHSARDVFEMMKRHGVVMEQKPFSIGVRIEHLQEKINKAQYGDFAQYLGAADYKFACHLPSGRSVYTFCMCPGGSVVAASSEEGRLVVNGMSVFSRNGRNANSAVLCNVEPEDFGSDDVLSGVDFQQKYEEMAYIAGGSNYCAPAQLVGDFLKNIPSKSCRSVKPTYPRGVRWGNLSDCLPDFAIKSIREALVIFGRKLRGFDDKDAVLTGVETRSSSPVRIKRNEQYQSVNMQGLYPCGEGAGYAGGITSAAVDGIRIAQTIIEELAEGEC